MIEEYDKLVDGALERGEDVEERLRFKTEEPVCTECGHAISLHEAEYGCDYEADRPDADIGQVAWRCGCKHHVVAKLEYVPTEVDRLSPEQEGCSHPEIRWNGYRHVFICWECGAQLVIPELEAARGLSVAWELPEFVAKS